MFPCDFKDGLLSSLGPESGNGKSAESAGQPVTPGGENGSFWSEPREFCFILGQTGGL